MCGRFTLSVSNKPDLANLGLQARDRFNIAPQSKVLMRRETGSFALERWGLTMSVSGRDKLVSNARLETLDAKRLFRDLAPCVLLADGWYEWQRVGSGRQPWYHHCNGLVLSMAGLYDPDQGCVIVTRETSAPLTQIHHRQPLLLYDDQVQAWLDDRLVEMTLPQPQIAFHPVSRRVGDARQDDPGLTAPVSLDAEKTGQTGDLFS
ncbi:MAG: SOS response-associated peptidase [Luminiphilus sp.]